MVCGRVKKYNFKEYYCRKYNIKTYGLVIPLLDGTVDFYGEDGKQYNALKEDLTLIEE